MINVHNGLNHVSVNSYHSERELRVINYDMLKCHIHVSYVHLEMKPKLERMTENDTKCRFRSIISMLFATMICEGVKNSFAVCNLVTLAKYSPKKLLYHCVLYCIFYFTVIYFTYMYTCSIGAQLTCTL